MAVVGFVLIFVLVFGLGMVTGGAYVASQARKKIAEINADLKSAKALAEAYRREIPPTSLPPTFRY